MSLQTLSVVIPVHNEESHLLPLYDRLVRVLEPLETEFEIVFVDDYSTDSSRELLRNLVESDERLKAVLLRRNFGQTAALAAGFEHAAGDVVIAMDGDLQHAPEDIPALLAEIEEGYDIASGWRERRIDNLITRRIPSKIANWLMARASGIELHDFDDALGFRIHGISADWVRELHDDGFEDLTTDDLMKIRIHGLDDIMRKRRRPRR